MRCSFLCSLIEAIFPPFMRAAHNWPIYGERPNGNEQLLRFQNRSGFIGFSHYKRNFLKKTFLSQTIQKSKEENKNT